MCDSCNPAQNGENAISARSDLNPANGTYPFGALRQRPHGGTDMKARNPFLLKNVILRPKRLLLYLNMHDAENDYYSF